MRDKHSFYGNNGRNNGYYGRERDRDMEAETKRSWDVSAEERWRCPECQVNNDNHQEYCGKCGTRGFRPSDSRRHRSDSFSDRRYDERDRGDRSRSRPPRHYDRSSPEYDRDRDRDYRGQPPHNPRGRMSEPRSERVKKPPPQREWPPQFESDGAAYIFDTRSGFFYEASSDFFYDPKTKLYYGNKKGKYFEYCSDVKPPFKVVAGPKAGDNVEDEPAKSGDGNTNTGSESPSNASNGAKPDKKEKKKIAICIKKKFNGKKEATPAVPKQTPEVSKPTVPPPQIKKKHAVNIEKWSARGREMRDHPNAAATKPTPEFIPTSNTKNTSVPASNEQPHVTKTVSGQPVCMLCKRKFADMLKLNQHIEQSALHKQNLERAQAAQSQQAPSAEYRDRAKERRVMYGPEATSPSTDDVMEMGPSLTKARVVTETETKRPDENLGDDNIGNQMLKKLGWKKGDALGQQKNQVVNKLQEDWETIETLANNNGKRNVGRGLR